MDSHRGGSRAATTSKMERFVIIVKPLTITTKHSILDVAAALDPSLSHVSQAMKFASSYSTSDEAMATHAMIITKEVMSYPKWKFETDLNNFNCPSMLQFFVLKLSCGKVIVNFRRPANFCTNLFYRI